MAIITQTILAALVAMFVVYVGFELRALRRARIPAKGSPVTPPGLNTPPPFVSVLLPVYNEKLVVEKLIEAVSRLDYPQDRLEILVLDDSADETGAIAAKAIASQQAAGVPIHHLRRGQRIGFKAGNLIFGMGHAKGDFIAIFDADCLPPPEFLRKVMPFFSDPKVGFLQTAIAFSNADAGLLTRFQAMEASHKEDVTHGFSKDGFMASLTGSSCVWRRACIEDIGGISSETITEDVDMGYAAQLSRWAYVFPKDVVSWAELPESMAAFRVQRQRWARGLTHNAFRHAREVFTSPMSPLARAHAISLVFSPLLLALFYLLLLLSPLVALSTPRLGFFFHVCCAIFLVAAGIWGWANTKGGNTATNGVMAAIFNTLGYILLFFPLSLYYFSAIIQTVAWGRGGFHSTPKGCGRKKIAHPRINSILLALESFSLLYAAATIFLACIEKNPWVVLYDGLAFGGFAMTLFFSFSDSRDKVDPGRHVLITGASGAIGSALALEYAAPGRRLTLQGRNADALQQLAGQCAARGAQVITRILDLTNPDATRQWAIDVARTDPPTLVIANAGLNTNTGSHWQGEPYEQSKALVEVNLLSTIALVDGVLPAMRARGLGQIALVSSLAAYYGLAATPTYCATKAALKNYGTSLRAWLKPEGIHVNVILPGYVESPMCAAMPGPKPFLWQPKRAARVIRKGLERDRAAISFPFPLNLGCWGLSVLPACLAMPIAKLLGYGR